MRLRFSITTSAAILLAACGGGGGGGGGGDEPDFGLDARVAPALNFPDTPVQASDVAFERAYPNLSFQSPLVVTRAPGDTTHLYVAQQGGLVRTFDASSEGTATSSVFLDLTDRTRANGEQGLLGLAFDPDYANNGFVYVNYSANANPDVDAGASVIARFQADRVTRTADRTSEVRLLQFSDPFNNHNGGALAFGDDGMLYISSGDGGGGGDPQNNAQNLGNLLGKILRIRPDGGIPADNPFVGRPGARGEIWAYGLRNPFRMSFDRATGRLWVGDVGQGAREEIDLVTRGGNYGWPRYEGNLDFDASRTVQNASPPTFPIHDYDRNVDTGGRSVTGGIVYRGSRIPELIGRYLYADFVSSRVWALTESDGVRVANVQLSPEPSPAGNPSSFGEDLDGEPLITSYAGSRLVRIVPASGGSGTLPATLSATGLFSDLATLTPAPGVVPYAPNAPFWSDGVSKRRWIAVPGGQAIAFSPSGNWTFPAGTVTVKHFEVGLASGSLQRLETRVFVHQSAGWQGYTYRWREDGTDADLLAGGATTTLATAGGPQEYEFPNRTQCLQCHTAAAGFVLGVRTSQLNGPLTYPNGVVDNQLRALDHAGYFTASIGSASSYPALPDPFGSAPTVQRARAYLETNCAQCHQPGGPTPLTMDLRASTPIGQTQTVGVAGQGAPVGGATVRIVPGDKESSLVWTRMNTLADDERMPPLSTHVIDAQGLALIGAWIDEGAN